jgi:hypothetical protein
MNLETPGFSRGELSCDLYHDNFIDRHCDIFRDEYDEDDDKESDQWIIDPPCGGRYEITVREIHPPYKTLADKLAAYREQLISDKIEEVRFQRKLEAKKLEAKTKTQTSELDNT